MPLQMYCVFITSLDVLWLDGQTDKGMFQNIQQKTAMHPAGNSAVFEEI